MVEHMTVNHMMRVRFPRETKVLKLSSIKVIVVVCKTKCMGSIPISALFSFKALALICRHRGGIGRHFKLRT
jgi:hypothetical protein